MSDILRLFIALPLPDEVQAILQPQQNHLKVQLSEHDKHIRWTTAGQWHLTLNFLGATNAERLPQIQNAMARAAKPVKAFGLETTSLGAFPSLQRPSVLWLGVGGDVTSLQTLQFRLTEALTGMIENDDQPFKPHLTLARLKKFGLGQSVREAFATASPEKSSWHVRELCLYQSISNPSGADYAIIHQVLLPHL
jgi:RNA 2',3'-cyclic 3'-phosphodiesterase